VSSAEARRYSASLLVVLKRTAALAAAVVALASCGEEDSKHKDEVERVVNEFAQADGPHACALLTPRALRQVYGGERPKRGYERCLRRSERFEGETIEIDDLNFRGNLSATVRASSPDEDRRYRVGVKNVAGTWLIDSIALVNE
jgi:hypothetical protein